MKKSDEQMLLIGGAAVVAYFLFIKKPATTTTTVIPQGSNTLQAANPNTSTTGQVVNQITSGLASIIKTITSGAKDNAAAPNYQDTVIKYDPATDSDVNPDISDEYISPGTSDPWGMLNSAQMAGMGTMGLMAGALVEELEY